MPARRHRIRTGDCFECIVAAYERRLLAYVTRLTGNPSVSEDIVQNVFFKFAASWRGEISDGPVLSSWLYRVAHNEAVDWVRRESRRIEVHEKHENERMENAGRGHEYTDAAYLAESALMSLSERERNIVILRVYEEKSYKEIAEITGLSVGNVGFILHGAMKKIAENLSSNGVADV